MCFEIKNTELYADRNNFKLIQYESNALGFVTTFFILSSPYSDASGCFREFN